MIQPASRVFYLADANYNVTAMVNTSGQVVERYVYDPYGAVTVCKPDWSGTQSPTLYNNSVLYTGQQLDLETGLYYCLARYYQPALGRFTACDPVGFGGGDVNLYQYVADAPVECTDPSGLSDMNFDGLESVSLDRNPVAKSNQAGSNWKTSFNNNDLHFIAQYVNDNGTFSVVCEKMTNKVAWSESYYESFSPTNPLLDLPAQEYDYHHAGPHKPAAYLARKGKKFSFSAVNPEGIEGYHLYIVEGGEKYKVTSWDFDMTARFDAVNGEYAVQWGRSLKSANEFKITELVINDDTQEDPQPDNQFSGMLWPSVPQWLPRSFPAVTRGPHQTIKERWHFWWEDGWKYPKYTFDSPKRYT